MPEPSWTPEDVELVAGWFKRFFGASVIRQRDRESATEVLAALAEAGRLLPTGARRFYRWGWRYPGETYVYDKGFNEAAARWNADNGVPGALLRREKAEWPNGSCWVGPWLPVEPAESKISSEGEKP